ncbi:MAG: hypothetical protein M3081_10575 [Gemmatimonadota bacterium]|nr:hypothetical protein [Gemmatimonadota bacterium]
MLPIRVVLADMPRMLHDIVRTILSAEPDIEIETTTVPQREIASARAITGADVVILAEPEAPTDEYAAMLYAHPRLRLVAISDDGRRAVLYELRPHRSPLGDMSPNALVQAVRGRSVHEGRT